MATSLKKHAQRLRYEEMLLEPPPEHLSLETFPDHNAVKRLQNNEAFQSRLRSIFNHYQLRPEDPRVWQDLAIHLLLDWVPGFKFANTKTASPGRRRKKVKLSDAVNYVQWIDDYMSRPTKPTQMQAISAYQKTFPKDNNWGTAPTSMANTYREMKKLLSTHPRNHRYQIISAHHHIVAVNRRVSTKNNLNKVPLHPKPPMQIANPDRIALKHFNAVLIRHLFAQLMFSEE